MDIHFTLTIEESNLMLIALSKLPYEHVAGLIDKLKTQAAGQFPPPVQAASANGADIQG